MSLSLPTLFSRILASAAKAANLPTIEDETQELITECLNDLKSLHSRIIELSIFSPNETLDDISTRDLVYLTVPYIFSEVQGRVKTSNRVDRLNALIQAEKYVQNYISLLENYEVVPADERTLYDRKVAQVADFAKRRELKINQYKKEKDLRARVETIRRRRGQAPAADDIPTDYDLISSLLPSSSPRALKTEEELDSETDEILRETTLLLLRLLYAHASAQLQSMEQELELLRNAPPSPIMGALDEDERNKTRKAEDNDWKLDIPIAGGPDGKGPLLDPAGKPLRPFTILPSDAGERARLQSQVFGPGHRLPTMSIDEYLEIERQRGNILTGGGAASQAAPTSSEQLAIDSEMDGTVEGEMKEETKRQKEENWALYTEANPRGAGNTMNRG
ncbi:serine/threonine protein phosphatase PP2A-associated protein [Flammula alnicola]|nr:serine/threonine protein phosphatase PP2A-associated protein [Flammula alnicola]